MPRLWKPPATMANSSKTSANSGEIASLLKEILMVLQEIKIELKKPESITPSKATNKK